MTAEQVAEHLSARRAGNGRWQAKCPAHDDRSPSLSIKEGEAGRVLLRCWAGCELSAVLKAAGLTVASLFPGPPPTPEQLQGCSAGARAQSGDCGPGGSTEKPPTRCKAFRDRELARG